MNTKAKVQNRSTKDDPIIRALPVACADEKAAVEFMEKQRWGDHPACPRCGDLDVYQMKDAKTGERQANFRWRCHGCKEQFTVRIGTVFEDSRIELRHWCFAFWRSATSKKGVSALEIHRQTGLSYKSALFMLHRIRFAMDEQDIEPLKGDVEVDELFVGGRNRPYNNSRMSRKKPKTPVIGLKERGGRVRPRVVADVTSASLKGAIRANVDKSSRILTDEWSGYRGIGKEYAGGHETVRHSTHEYARGDVHTNSIEGFFGMVRRGLDGIYHSVSRKHLHRYLSEFEFRHNHRELDDGERTVAAIRAANNKRLTYAEQVGNGK
jgi:transposase-like protein